VGRVAITYAAVAWFTIEVADTTFSMVGIPDAYGRLVLVLLLIGFPIALVLGWIFDIGPAGVERTDSSDADTAPDARPSRGWALVAAGAAVGAALVWGLPRVTAGVGVRGAEHVASADVIAVLPFRVLGSAQHAYLGEGIVDLVSAKLDGAGEISTVDPRVVIAAVDARGGASDPASDRAAARRMRAGRYLTGEVVEAGDRIRVTAQLHSTVAADGSAPQATVEGATGEIFELLDHLVAELLASSLEAEGARFRALATITTHSLEAAKAYLQGEQFARKGLYRDAAAAYDRALARDSTFALAHYRKSIAADWIDAFTARTDADRAYRFRNQLPPRDQALVAALRLRRHGKIMEAEQAFRALLHQYPDDVEALLQLAELYFHDNPRRGRPIGESVELFERALALEPHNPISQVHLARIYALHDSIDQLNALAEVLTETAPDAERTLEVMALYGYLAGDTAIQGRVKREIERRPWYYTFHAVHGVGRFARDPFGAADLLESRPSDDPLLLSLVPNHLVVRGKYSQANAWLDRRRLERNATWDIYRAFLLTSGAVPLDTERMTALLPALAAITPGDLRRTAWLQPYEDITDRFLDFQRDYYRALILIQLGRADESRALVAALADQPDFVGTGSFKADAVLSLRAETLLKGGDRRGTLEALQSMRFEIPHALSYQPMADQSRARFLRGELELELGDPTTGNNFLVGLDEPWSIWDTYHRPLLYRSLGQAAEDQGRAEEAIDYYSRLVRLWRDCDPELVPIRQELTEKLRLMIG
jgi:tetratricopeptide (TPR) repeat protein